jgi:hypothetical protein
LRFYQSLTAPVRCCSRFCLLAGYSPEGWRGFAASNLPFTSPLLARPGEIRALSSMNRSYIETIVGAINEAVIRYR